jgi:hypothetical protein
MNTNLNNNNVDYTNINQLDDIIDVFKSREINDSNMNDENIMHTSQNRQSRDEGIEDGESKNLNETKDNKKYHKSRTIRKSGNFNFLENSKYYAQKGGETIKDDGPKHRKNMSSINNPFMKNFEAEIINKGIV